MREFILSYAEGVRQKQFNTKYGTQATISSLDDLKRAVQFDHVAGMFRSNERSNDNLISADCLIMDCDNDHTEDTALWLTPKKLSERLKDVEFVIVYSKSHMRVKKSKHAPDGEGYSARPRFHIYLPLSEHVTDPEYIRGMKERLIAFIPEFDEGAKDAARYIAGVENPQGNFFEGSLCVDEFLTLYMPEEEEGTPHNDDDQSHEDSELDADTHAENVNASDDDTHEEDSQPILEGGRNTSLFTKALDLLKQYGEKKARSLYDKFAQNCKPPLPAGEVIRTWNQALKYAKAIEDRVRERQKKILTLRVVEQALKDMNISVRFNVITKTVEVSDLPNDNENAPEAYYSLDQTARKKANAEILPPFLTSYFKSKNYGVSDRFITDAISAMASIHPLNPVLDMLNSTTWDGHDRIAELYPVLGIIPDMHRSFLRKWLHQAVALAQNDTADLNSDFVLVLQGAQGLGKTNFFRALAMIPEWFTEGAVIDMRDKDSIIQATSTWITEIGELDSTLKKEQTSLKGFITAKNDTYRKPYGRKAEKIERRTCFCATVNPAETLRDDTGSRRFAVIHVDRIDKNFVYNVMTPDWCAQLWKQVYEWLYLRNGRKGFYLTDEELAFIEASNTAFTVMLDGESELLDSLAWESDIDTWHWTTIKELETRCLYLKDKRYNPKKIGRALTRILSDIATRRGTTIDAFKRILHGRFVFKLPTVRNVEYEDE